MSARGSYQDHGNQFGNGGGLQRTIRRVHHFLGGRSLPRPASRSSGRFRRRCERWCTGLTAGGVEGRVIETPAAAAVDDRGSVRGSMLPWMSASPERREALMNVTKMIATYRAYRAGAPLGDVVVLKLDAL